MPLLSNKPVLYAETGDYFQRMSFLSFFFKLFFFFVEEEVIPLTGKGSGANLVLIGVVFSSCFYLVNEVQKSE